MSETEKPFGIHIDAANKRADLPEFDQEGRCKEHPNAEVETGFGLAGGGFGVYSFCAECGTILSKSEVDE